MAITAAWEAAITGWVLFARRASSPATTIRTRTDQLRHLARSLGEPDPWAVTGDQLVDWFQAQAWAVETRRGRRTTFRVFYAWAVEAGYVAVSPAAALPKVRLSTRAVLVGALEHAVNARANRVAVQGAFIKFTPETGGVLRVSDGRMARERPGVRRPSAAFERASPSIAATIRRAPRPAGDVDFS